MAQRGQGDTRRARSEGLKNAPYALSRLAGFPCNDVAHKDEDDAGGKEQPVPHRQAKRFDDMVQIEKMVVDQSFNEVEPSPSSQHVTDQPPTCCACVSPAVQRPPARSEERTSELQSLMRISYAAFCM